MICFENQHFDINRILLLAIGLWPYQQSKFARFQFTFFSGILTTAVIFQLTALVTSRNTSNFIVKILSTALFFSMFVITYNAFRFNMQTVKDLLAKLRHVCDELKDENEIAILEKYGYNAKRYTALLTIFAIFSIAVILITQFCPSILDFALNINKLQSHRSIIMTEYFIDEKKYFFLTLLHMNAAFSIGVIATLATGVMLITYYQYTCGMFKIASYRIKNTMRINMLQNINLKKNNFMFKGIVCAVDIHRQAMKLSVLLTFRFEAMLCCLIAIGVISLSLNLLRIVSSGDDPKELLMPLLSVAMCILYMFIANYVGQNLTDHSNHIFVTAYDVQWYIAPLHIQKLILFLLQRGNKEFTMNIGGLFIGSLQCFATLVNASVSYCTVIYSMR